MIELQQYTVYLSMLTLPLIWRHTGNPFKWN